jgi:serine/threonine protein kinase
MPVLKTGSRLGPYTVLELLRVGGMACIYLAEYTPPAGGVSTRVAVKLANTAADVPRDRTKSAAELEAFYYEALSNEVEVLKKLHHPNIVRLQPIPWGIKRDPYIARATNVTGAPWFYAMDYLPGGSVAQLTETHKPLESKLAVEIAYQVALALDYMHAKGYAHLDVKPDNILLRASLGGEGGEPPQDPQAIALPQAVLIDFGIARRHQQQGLEAGSLPYMPPEMIPLVNGTRAPELAVSSPPVDIYAVGVLLYQLLTGHLPFSGRNDSHVTTAILRSDPTRPSVYNHELPENLEELVLQIMQKDPERRPSAQELVLLLDGAVSPRVFAPAAGANAAVLSRTRNRDRQRLRVYAGAAILFAALSVGQLLWQLKRDANLANQPASIVATATVASLLTPPTATFGVAVTATPVVATPIIAAPATATPPPTLPVYATATPVNTRTPTPSPLAGPRSTLTPGIPAAGPSPAVGATAAAP